MAREADDSLAGVGRREPGEAGPDVLLATLTVQHPRHVLGPTMGRLPAATIESDCPLDGPPATPTFFEINGVGQEQIERALDDDPTVTAPRCVASGDSAFTYRVQVTASAVALQAPAAERGIQVQSASRANDGWRLQLRVPGREALSDFRGYCIDRGVDVSIDRLCKTARWSGQQLALPERYRETLQVALDAGYYEVPRTATQDDLAEVLDVSGSAVSQRLRRATRSLVARSLEPTEEGPAGTGKAR